MALGGFTRAGMLNRRVTIESQDASYDDNGQQVLTWSEVATVWASIATVGGIATIRTQSDADLSVARYAIRIRWLEGLDAGMRVAYGSDIYDIRSVQYDMANREFVDLICFKGGSDG